MQLWRQYPTELALGTDQVRRHLKYPLVVSEESDLFVANQAIDAPSDGRTDDEWVAVSNKREASRLTNLSRRHDLHVVAQEVLIAIRNTTRVVPATESRNRHHKPRLLFNKLNLYVNEGIIIVHIHFSRGFGPRHVQIHPRGDEKLTFNKALFRVRNVVEVHSIPRL